MKEKYDVVWGSDPGECGIWLGNKIVVSAWELSKRGLTSWQVCQWSQQALANLVEKVTRKSKSLGGIRNER